MLVRALQRTLFAGSPLAYLSAQQGVIASCLRHCQMIVRVPVCWDSSRVARRLEKLGIGPDGKPLPMPNTKKVFPRMYKLLLVNQDGSTYTIHHRYPHRILTLPLDPSTLSEEERAKRERQRQAERERVYVEEEPMEEDTWDQSQYRHLI